MRKIKEPDIFKLRQSGNVMGNDGANLKSVIPLAAKKVPVPEATAEEQRMKSIEGIVSKLADALKANDKNAMILMDLIRKDIIKPGIKMPDFPKPIPMPKPIVKWEFTVARDNLGYIEAITAEAM